MHTATSGLAATLRAFLVSRNVCTHSVVSTAAYSTLTAWGRPPGVEVASTQNERRAMVRSTLSRRAASVVEEVVLGVSVAVMERVNAGNP